MASECVKRELAIFVYNHSVSGVVIFDTRL